MLKNFTICRDINKPNTAIMWLQSLDEGDFAMPVMIPNVVFEDYAPSIAQELLDDIGDYDLNDLMLLVTLTVPGDIKKMTTNLKAPIIVNPKNRYACQLIADNEEYLVRQPIYDILKKKKEDE